MRNVSEEGTLCPNRGTMPTTEVTAGSVVNRIDSQSQFPDSAHSEALQSSTSPHQGVSECLVQESELSDTPNHDSDDTVAANRIQMNDNSSLQSSRDVPLSDPSDMKKLEDQIWFLMTDHATKISTDVGRVWDILRRNIDNLERVGWSYPVSSHKELR